MAALNHIPKISVITPNYNQGDFLEQTIQSVLDQNYPNLEYIIIDGGSTDQSVEIIKKYEDSLSYWVSEPDMGMYHAINKGFDLCTGDIMCWINSDDILWEGSLAYLAKIMGPEMNKVEWLQGYPTVIDEEGKILYRRDPVAAKKKFYNLEFKKDRAFIQQESTFWTRSLWERSKARLNTEYTLAADFDLWMQFFHYSRLFCSRRNLGAFRKRKGQKSQDQEAYLQEAIASVDNHRKRLTFMKLLRLRFSGADEPIYWID
ncbi:glycosyltransferase [Aureitalea sp. L0-47]|uniref:glycosyltransferase family 2 protein n=1 Tax=Aureitalea sp. L0-47 TaxID=2816962 RepID=UPI00223889B2|nr:glycosyltransferase family 2 protein [Aureitalea sp. L0-47]MCW5519189.1 glycosyltransferase [Aureitalea sp. L0-47]